ncbi:Ankyrin repeat-containing protein, partial [Drosera capensis]
MGTRGDTVLHSAVKAGDLEEVLRILNSGEDVMDLVSKKNLSGETSLYVAAECGHVEMVRELVKHYDDRSAGIIAKNGLNAFHVAARQGNLEVLKVLSEEFPGLQMTTDVSNTTALRTSASRGHTAVVNFLLESRCNLVTIARNNKKTALHAAARNGHLEVVRVLMNKEPSIAMRVDKKGQTALHMAVKGQSTELVDVLISPDSSLINLVDSKGNTALHIATRKGRTETVLKLLGYNETNTEAINKSGETALDIAEKLGFHDIAVILREHGVRNAKSISQALIVAQELKQTVCDIKVEVNDQIVQTRRTRKGMREIAKRLSKMQQEGINNAINSSTVVAVLIASIAFGAIFMVPGVYANPRDMAPGLSVGEAFIAPTIEFSIFFIFDSIALFISLAVVVVQTSVVVIEKKAKKRMAAVINKLMWSACVFMSVSFLALSFIVVGDQVWLAVAVTGIGTAILATTLGLMCYWVVKHRIEAKKFKSTRKSLSRSCALSMISDPEILELEYKKLNSSPGVSVGSACEIYIYAGVQDGQFTLSYAADASQNQLRRAARRKLTAGLELDHHSTIEASHHPPNEDCDDDDDVDDDMHFVPQCLLIAPENDRLGPRKVSSSITCLSKCPNGIFLPSLIYLLRYSLAFECTFPPSPVSATLALVDDSSEQAAAFINNDFKYDFEALSFWLKDDESLISLIFLDHVLFGCCLRPMSPLASVVDHRKKYSSGFSSQLALQESAGEMLHDSNGEKISNHPQPRRELKSEMEKNNGEETEKVVGLLKGGD